MQFPADSGLADVLVALGVRPEALLGHGGEAWVYALDDERVIRVLHGGATREMVVASGELVARLSRVGAPFALPELLDVGEVGGRWYAVERGDWWGELLRVPLIRAERWHAYLRVKAEASLALAGVDFAGIDADALSSELPAPAARSFVHLDAFPGNVLAVGTTITAVIDFGATTVVGDRRLDPLASAIYLTPEITPTATNRDRDVAYSWLRNASTSCSIRPSDGWPRTGPSQSMTGACTSGAGRCC